MPEMPMSFDQFVELFNSRVQPSWSRMGQHAFNTLHEVAPELANKVRATDVDPFYRDDRINKFWQFVAENWV